MLEIYILHGAQGYNNAVKLLDEICNTCYSNTEIGAVGKSFDIEYIIDKLKTKPAEPVSPPTYTYDNTHYYPIIHLYEEYSDINGRYIAKGGTSLDEKKAITEHEQKDNRYITATEQGATNGYIKVTSTLKSLKTYINPSVEPSAFENTKYSNLVTKIGDTTTNLKSYWLASRSVNNHSSGYTFIVRRVVGGSVNGNGAFSSNLTANVCICAVRPIVEIPLDTIMIGLSGDGTATSPFGLLTK